MCFHAAATVILYPKQFLGLIMGALTQVRVMGGTVSLAIWLISL